LTFLVIIFIKNYAVHSRGIIYYYFYAPSYVGE